MVLLHLKPRELNLTSPPCRPALTFNNVPSSPSPVGFDRSISRLEELALAVVHARQNNVSLRSRARTVRPRARARRCAVLLHLPPAVPVLGACLVPSVASTEKGRCLPWRGSAGRGARAERVTSHHWAARAARPA